MVRFGFRHLVLVLLLATLASVLRATPQVTLAVTATQLTAGAPLAVRWSAAVTGTTAYDHAVILVRPDLPLDVMAPPAVDPAQDGAFFPMTDAADQTEQSTLEPGDRLPTAPGDYTFLARIVLADGTVVDSDPVTLTVAAPDDSETWLPYHTLLTPRPLDSQNPLTAVVLTPDPASPLASLGTVTLTATPTGGTNVQYQFFAKRGRDSAYTVVQTYSTSATCDWTPTVADYYRLRVWAKDGGSQNQFDCVHNIPYYAAVSPLSAVTATTDLAFPQPTNTTVTVTATPTGGSDLEYRFYVKRGNNAATIVQDYSAAATYAWTPTTADFYQLIVYAREVGSTATYDKSTVIRYYIGTTPLSALAVTTDLASPQATNTTIVVTGTPTGGVNLQYRFYVKRGNNAATMVQDYSATATYAWHPTVADYYQLIVYVREVGSSFTYDLLTTIPYYIGTTPLTAVSGSVSPASPQAVNTATTLTATPTGGVNLEYKFHAKRGGDAGFTTLQGYAASTTCGWTPTQAGYYLLLIYAREVGSTLYADQFVYLHDYVDATPLTGVSLSASPAAPQPINYPITLTATPAGGYNVEYRFYEKKPGDTAFTLKRDYSTSPTYSWTPTQAVNYTIQVDCREVGDSSETYRFAASQGYLATTGPHVVLTAPSDNTTILAFANLTLTATASDADGTVTKVSFYQGSTKLGEDTTSPYSYTWTQATPGSYTLTAKATDNDGNVTTSLPVTLTVTGNNQPPTVALTAPTDQATYTAPASVTLSATAADTDGAIAKVEFFAGVTKLGEDTTAPYSYNWTNVGVGSYVLTAVATDSSGCAVAATPVTITVRGANSPPTVALTAPSTGARLFAPATVTLTATAFDSDGAITKVEFYQGTTKLGEDTSAPYSYAWSNVAAGTYSLTAVATDDANSVVASDAVTITVDAPPAVTIDPALGTTFAKGRTITIPTIPAQGATVTNVDFYVNGVYLDSATTAPFSCTLDTGTADQTLSVTVVATEANARVSAADPYVIQVGAPTFTTANVTMQSPKPGTTVPVGTDLVYTLTTTTTPDHVDVLVDGALRATLPGPGPTFTWTYRNPPAGIHQAAAVVHYASGQRAQLQRALGLLLARPPLGPLELLLDDSPLPDDVTAFGAVLAKGANQPPTVNIFNPYATGNDPVGLLAVAGQQLIIPGEAFDLDGAVTAPPTITITPSGSGPALHGQAHWVDGATSAHWEFAWWPATAGTFDITATVTDTGGVANPPASQSVTVDAGAISAIIATPLVANNPPTTFQVGEPVPCYVSAYKENGVAQTVTLHAAQNGGGYSADISAADVPVPAAVLWATGGLTAADYTVTATAKDAAGNTGTNHPSLAVRLVTTLASGDQVTRIIAPAMAGDTAFIRTPACDKPAGTVLLAARFFVTQQTQTCDHWQFTIAGPEGNSALKVTSRQTVGDHDVFCSAWTPKLQPGTLANYPGTYTITFQGLDSTETVKAESVCYVTLGTDLVPCVHYQTPAPDTIFTPGQPIPLRIQLHYLSPDVPAVAANALTCYYDGTHPITITDLQYQTETRTWTGTWLNPPPGTHTLSIQVGQNPTGPDTTAITVLAPLPGWRDNSPRVGGVNLATGGFTYDAGSDLSVYNPHGPAVSFGRTFVSALALQNSASPGLTRGWVHTYDTLIFQGNDGHYWLQYPDRSLDDLGTTKTQPTGAPYKVTTGTNTLTLTLSDLSTMTFTKQTGVEVYWLTTITDKTGHGVTLSWDAYRRLTAITNDQATALMTVTYPTGDTLTVTDALHTTKTRYVEITASMVKQHYDDNDIPNGTVTEMTYGYTGYLLHTLQPHAPWGMTTIDYDAANRVQTLTDPNGAQTRYHYSLSGITPFRVLVQQTDADGNLVGSDQYRLNGDLAAVSVTDAQGHATTLDYQAGTGRVASIKDATSWTTTTYGDYGNVATTTDVLHATTYTTSYDTTSFAMPVPYKEERTVGQQGAVTLSEATFVTTGGQTYPVVKTVTTPKPGNDYQTVTTTYTYDIELATQDPEHADLWNPVQLDAPGADGVNPQTTVYHYTNAGRATPRLGQPVAIIAQNNGQGGDLTTTLEYDAADRQTATVTPTGRTEYVPNAAGQTKEVVSKTLAGARISSVRATPSYLGGPAPTTELLDADSAVVQSVTSTFGPAGEVLSTTGAGEDVYWAQGAQGQQAMKSDGNGNTSTFFTDSAGVTQHWLRPDGHGAGITAQNGGGQVTETTDADNQVVAHAYDDDDVQHDYTGTHAYLGSTFGVNSPRNSAVTYNPAGWTSSVGNGVGGAAVNGFDSQGAPTSVTTTIANGNTPIVWTVTPSLYDNGAVHVLTTPAGPYTYEYDGLGRLHKIIAPDMVHETTWDYDQTTGRLSRKTLPNGAYTTYAYNDMGQVSALINYDVNDTALSTYDNFAYDTDGRLVSYDTAFGVNTALDGARSYTYDAHDRLATESYAPLNLDNQAYDYDDAGNHVTTGQNTFHGHQWTPEAYDRSNQFTDANNFGYNHEGDPSLYKGQTLTFDAEHHLTGYGTALTAAALVDGKRAWKQVGNARTFFCYDGDTLIGQQTGTNAQDFVPILSGPGGLIAYGDTCYQFDPEGNVVHRTDADGELVTTSVYDAWGQATDVLPDGDPATVSDPFGYKGQAGYYTDHETGLILCTHRYYDPELGRWLTRDPNGYDGGVNLFGYCGGDPVTLIDSTGEIPTPMEAAIMANDIYDAIMPDNNNPNTVKPLLGGWVLIDIIQNKQSLKIGIYARQKEDGTTEYAFVNKGTSFLNGWCWENNLTQPFGWSRDMLDSLADANDFVANHPTDEITFVGHSKGGAEAEANAVKTKRNCMVFNPATVNFTAYHLPTTGYSAHMTAYIVKGEILNNLFGWIPRPVGSVVYLPRIHGHLPPLLDPMSAVQNHLMPAVMEGLKRKGLQ